MTGFVLRKCGFKEYFFYISFYCTTSLITDYKYTQVTINGLQEMHPVILLLLSSITTDWVWLLIFTRFLDHTQRRTTVGRTPLNEWSVRHRDLYLTTHNNHNSQSQYRIQRDVIMNVHRFSSLSILYSYQILISGFGGLEVACWAFGTQVRGFKPGRSRRNFKGK